MKRFLFILSAVLALSLVPALLQAQILDLETTEEGVLLPRLTTSQRMAVASPSQSELVYDTDTKTFWYWEDMDWVELGSTAAITGNVYDGGEVFPGTAIPDGNATGISSTISLSDTGIIEGDIGIMLCLDITHPYTGDIDVSLTAPDGLTTIDLTSDNGGGGDNYTNTCFSDDAIVTIIGSSAPFTGLFIPEEAFSAFVGQAIAGDWVLTVVDDAVSDEGTLNSWSIEIGELNPSMANVIIDADGDTKIEVEKTLDEDIIRFEIGGNELFQYEMNESGNYFMNMSSFNSVNGRKAGEALTTGFGNALLGAGAGEALTTGNLNTLLGTGAGQSLTDGYHNTMLGSDAGQLNTGFRNVFLGYSAGRNETGNHKLVIANSSITTPLIYGEFDNKLLRVNGDLQTQGGSGFFTSDTGGLPTGYGRGIRVYLETPSDKGRIFAYDYTAGEPIDLSLQATGGNVAIGGTYATGYRLSVDGRVACEEVLVDFSGDWPDYVFESDYGLLSLKQVAQHIEDKGHLPGVPSAKEVEENGLQLGEMNKILMEKIEELTLYLLEQEERVSDLEKVIVELKSNTNDK